MKKLIAACVLLINIQLSAQLTKDSVIGTWEYYDNDSQLQQLIITQDSVTVVARVPVYPENKTWTTVTYSGSYTIIDGKIIHVVFYEDPREESFYHVTHFQNGEMEVVLNDSAKHKRGKNLKYRRNNRRGVQLIPQ